MEIMRHDRCVVRFFCRGDNVRQEIVYIIEINTCTTEAKEGRGKTKLW